MNKNTQAKKRLTTAHRQLDLARDRLNIDKQFGMMGFILLQDKKAIESARVTLKKARIAYYIG